MARYLKGTKVDFPELEQIKAKMKQRFAPNVTAKFLGAALNKVTKPARDALKKEIRGAYKQVSGNLLRSVTSVVRRYPRSGNAVAAVGFQKTGKKKIPEGPVEKGKDRGYHAGILIFGTKIRRTRKSVASSWNKRGPFTIKGRAKRGKFAGSTRVRTVPKSPRAFFKRAPKGEKVNLGRMYGNDVISSALKSVAPEIRRILREEMSTVVERAARYLQTDFGRRNRS